MLNFIKKYKTILITVVIAITILTIAFFAGGNNKNTSTASFDEAVNATEVCDISTAITSADKSSNNRENTENSTKSNSTNSTSASKNQISSLPSTYATYESKITDKAAEAKSFSKDKYNKESIPEEKPKTVEPKEQEINKDKSIYCTLSISYKTILNNMDKLDPDKTELISSDGWILKPVRITVNDGETVYDVLKRICISNKIHLETSTSPIYNTAYVEGINNIYEFDCGDASGWKFKVNDWFPNYGCSHYKISNGDNIQWLYTCNYGQDIGMN